MSFDEDKLRLMWEKTIQDSSLSDKDPSLTYGHPAASSAPQLDPALFPTLVVSPIESNDSAEAPTQVGPEFAATIQADQDATLYSPPPDQSPADTFSDPNAPALAATIRENADPDATIVADSPGPKVTGLHSAKPQTFQNYDLKKEIGRGGMGIVYEARQGGLDRLVAVKKIIDNQVEARSRFISEAIVTGQLDHPNIVPVYDMGISENGEVLLSMKLVGGQSWSDWLIENYNDNKKLPEDKLLEAFEILIKVCDAISFSHEKMIVHNDLKPENVMVGKHGEVFVMDWGLAVDVGHRDDAELTQSQRQTLHKSTLRSPCGTPAYMAPELANGDGDQICPQTDVYLLGAILYELVTGRRRHRGKTLLIVLRSAVLSEEPDFSDHPDVELELQDICRKAMRLDPEDRYASAKEFQVALRNHLQHRESYKIAHVARQSLEDCEKARLNLMNQEEQTLNEGERNRLYGQYADVVAGFKQALILWDDNDEAKQGLLDASVAYAKIALSQNDLGLAEAQLAALPPGLNVTLEISRGINKAKQILIDKETLQKRIRWALASTVVLIFLGLAIGLYFINKEKSRATENAQRAQKGELEAKANADEAKRQADIAKQKSIEALRQKKKATEQSLEALRRKREAEQQRVIAEKQKALALKAATLAEIEAARAQSLKNEADYQTAMARYELALGTAREGDGFVLAERWHLARQSYAKARAMFQAIGQPVLPADLGLWTCHRVQSPLILKSKDTRNSITAMTSHPTKNWIITGHGTGTIKVWDVHSGRVLHSWIGHRKEVRALAVSPDGRFLLSGSGAPSDNLFVWAISEERPYSISFRGQPCPVNSVVFNRRGTHFFTVGDDGTLRYWSMSSRTIVRSEKMPNASWGRLLNRKGVLSIDISPNNEYLAVGPASGVAYILDMKNRVRKEIPHRLAVTSVQFSPSGDFVISASSDGTIKLTDTKSGVVKNTFVGHGSLVMKAVLSPDGQKILSCSEDRTARIWDVKTGKTLRILGPLRRPIHNVAFSGDGRFAVAAGYQTGQLMLWSVDEDPGVTQFQKHPNLNSALATSPNGLLVATATRDRSFVLWDAKTGFPLKSFSARQQVQSLAFSPDSHRVFAGYNRMIKIWDLRSGQCLHTLKLDHGGYIYSLELTEDGQRCLSGNADGSVTVWDLKTNNALHKFQLEEARFRRRHIAVSPTQDTYAVSIGSAIEFFDSQTFKKIQSLKIADADCMALAFSRDGDQLYSLSSKSKKDFQLTVYEWRSGRILNSSACSGHDRRINAIAFSPSRDFVATIGRDLRLRLWQCRDGRLLLSFAAHRSFIMNIVAGAKDAQFVTVTRGESIRLWDFQNSAALEAKLKERFDPKRVAFLEKQADSSRAKLIRGQWLAFRGQSALALKYLESAKKGGEAVSDLSLARLYWKTKQWTQSEACFQRLLKSGKWPKHLNKSYLEMCLQTVKENGERLKAQAQPVGRIVTALIKHPDKEHLIVAGSEQGVPATISIVNMKTRRVVRRLYGHKKSPTTLSVSENGRWLLSGSSEDAAILWHLETGRLAHKLPGHKRSVTFVKLNKKATKAVTVGDDQQVRIWELRWDKPPLKVKPHKYFLRTSAVSPDFQTLVTSDTRGQIVLSNLKSGECSKPVPGHNRSYKAMSFSPDGRLIAMSARDSSLQIWSLEPFEQLYNLDGQVGLAYNLFFSDDSKLLLSVGYDKTARVWDLASKKLIQEIKDFDTALLHGAFLNDGKSMVLGDQNGTLWFHDLPSLKKSSEDR